LLSTVIQFSDVFSPYAFLASHLRFDPLLLTTNAPFTPVSSFPTLSPFRGCQEKQNHPLLRTIVQLFSVFSSDALFSFASAVLSAFAHCQRSVHSGFFHHHPFTL
jgi:hypothetical protein